MFLEHQCSGNFMIPKSAGSLFHDDMQPVHRQFNKMNNKVLVVIQEQNRFHNYGLIIAFYTVWGCLLQLRECDPAT
jgi:hypothetical protein